MNSFSLRSVLGCVAISGIIHTQPLTAEPRPSQGYVPGELLVKWADGPESHAAVIGNSTIGATVKRNFNAIGWQYVQLPEGISISEAITKYRALGTVLVVEPNYVAVIDPAPIRTMAGSNESTADVSAVDSVLSSGIGLDSTDGKAGSGLTSATTSAGVIPNDPKFNQQWNLKKIGMPAAWTITTGSSNVIVASMDTGVDYNHPDLTANMWSNPGETGLDANGNDKATNGVDDDGDGYVDDVHGIDAQNHTGDPIDVGFTGSTDTVPFFHGTACAGILGAVGNNGKGVAGVCWGVKIMALRASGDQGSSIPVRNFLAAFLESYDYVITMRRRGANVRVILFEFGFFSYIQALKDAADAAGNEGILNVIPAHNQGYNLDLFGVWPAACDSPSVISVAATGFSDVLSAYSNYGGSTVDLAAPSADTDYIMDITTTGAGSGYTDFGGTSAATPHVAGAAALLLSVKPDATPLELKAALMQSVDRIPSLVGKVVSNGRLNVARALQVLTNTSLPAVVVGSSPAGPHSRADAPIEVVFNRSMDRASVEAAFQISPAVTGTFQWTNDDRAFRFLHADPFLTTTNYTCKILGTARDVSGLMLDGNFSRTSDASPSDDYVWTFRFPLPNDDFADAQPISESSGTIAGNNRYSTFDLDDQTIYPDGPKSGWFSVWYRWAADATGWVTFDLSQSNKFDTVLGVFTGGGVDQLTTVASNDNDGSKRGSRVSFAAVHGASYAIAVAGKFGTILDVALHPLIADSLWGDFVLNWYPTPPPGFTGAAFSPAQGLAGSKVILTGTNFTGSTGVLFNGVSASFSNAPTNNADLRITAIVPPGAGTGPITVQTPHGDATTASSFVISAPSLAIESLDATRVIIQWQEAGAILEVTDSLGAGANWTRASNSVTGDANADFSVVLSTTNGPRFYRLHTP